MSVLGSKCNHTPVSVTGCGGGDVTFPDGIADCHFPVGSDQLPAAICKELCAGFDARDCHTYGTGADVKVFCDAAHPCMGRLASASELERGAYSDPVADHLALARRMEAQSVGAFAELANDLARWGAPEQLIAACRRAAADEARHADAMASLLVARGVRLETLADHAPAGFASLYALAVHNEREGCVGETWGALIAAHQAAVALDPDVRAAMSAIADEEAEHAAISFAIAGWARTQLAPAEIAALDAARQVAAGALGASIGARPDPVAADALGWPSPAITAQLLATVATQLRC